MKLIVGLGNIGKQYENTRHNMGFMAIDAFAKELGVSFSEKPKFKGMLAQTTYQGETILLLKPTTYMNLSGEAIQAVVKFYNIPLNQILVIYDDLDLKCGDIRIRQKGSAGGHNGIRSIIDCLGSEAFHRLRIGIDRHEVIPVVDYVLGKPTPEQKPLLESAIELSRKAIKDWLTHDIIYVMNKYN